jgi:molybdenum cofactor cytidylyltransferase
LSVGAVLLAAGSSSRLGQPKQLLRLRGETLLRHAATVTLAAGASPVVVVLGSQADAMFPELDGLAVETVVNPDWSLGMGASLQAGLRRLEEHAAGATDAVLVVLCDQPLVTREHLEALIGRYRHDEPAAAASEYADGVFGPPCLFSRPLFPALMALTGAQGARAVLGTLPPDRLSRVSFPEGLMDIDTMEDWERVKERSL